MSHHQRADGRRERAAHALLVAAGIADQLGPGAVFNGRADPARTLHGWVLADLASGDQPPQQRVRLLIAVGSHAVYGFPLTRWGRDPTGPPLLLDPATDDSAPPRRSRRATLLLRERATGTLLRLSGSRFRHAEAQAALSAIRARPAAETEANDSAPTGSPGAAGLGSSETEPSDPAPG